MLTLVMPQSDREMNLSDSASSEVKIAEDSPCGTSLWISSASSRSE